MSPRAVIRVAAMVVLAAAAGCGDHVREVAEAPPGKAHSPGVLTDIEGRSRRPLAPEAGQVHVLLFLNPDCPIANQYAPAISRLRADFEGDDVRFFLIHVDPDVTPEQARRHAEEYALAGPILLDARHELVRATGATVTPEAVVISPGGEHVYRGRIDNWYGDIGRKRPRATRHDLRDAITAVIEGREVETPRTEAVGCFIPALDG